MRFQHILLPAIALGGAATLLLPSVSEGFTTLGGALGPTLQRDVRMFNNFVNAGANDNVTPDANFPGWDGAEMAAWKAVVEWGSTLHGTGNGDPHQPAALGSGGANFDAAWGGNATSVGGMNDNVMSLIPGGCGGGTLAYCETPINNGWRIRFCDEWTWADGPNTNVAGVDIQGVACHEYGHALGLGHTSTSGATMYPSITGTGVGQRSIAPDDIAGVQFIYSVASVIKPIITNVTESSGTVTVTGQNFDTPITDVWFTSANPTAPTTFGMVMVTGASSTGTQITLALPAGAGSGDVLVKNAGTAHETLSNAWPLDLGGGNPGCIPPSNFCIAAPNSFTGGAIMTWSGSTLIASNDFVVSTMLLPPNKLCIYLYGQVQIAATPFGNGWRCVGSPFSRIYPGSSDSNGNISFALDLNNLPPSGPINAGDIQYFMCWYRDPAAGGAFFNGSDALETHWCP